MIPQIGTHESLDILHLAFEDHRRPGSGGGGLRTHEINRRLASRHRVTVVVARYPGARRRVEDGVRYRPVGLNLGYLGSVVTYHLAIPWLLLWHWPDLVIEDFSAPNSSDLVPLWTRSATLALVQWLFARETSERYHLPFWLPENTGVRLHHRFIAASGYIANRLRALNPGADIDVVYAGVECPPTGVLADRGRSDVLFMGRLEFGPKGLDLLVEAFSLLADVLPGVRLRIAGDGPHRARLEAVLMQRGLAGRVDWLGRLTGDAKWAALRAAALVVQPSRYESFGLVALEALAAGTPVVAFALPSFVEIVGVDCGVLVSPGDTVALASAMRDLLTNAEHWRTLSEAGPVRASRFNWDQAAHAHERIYLDTVRAHRARRQEARTSWLAGHRRRFRIASRAGLLSRRGSGSLDAASTVSVAPECHRLDATVSLVPEPTVSPATAPAPAFRSPGVTNVPRQTLLGASSGAHPPRTDQGR